MHPVLDVEFGAQRQLGLQGLDRQGYMVVAESLTINHRRNVSRRIWLGISAISALVVLAVVSLRIYHGPLVLRSLAPFAGKHHSTMEKAVEIPSPLDRAAYWHLGSTSLDPAINGQGTAVVQGSYQGVVPDASEASVIGFAVTTTFHGQSNDAQGELYVPPVGTTPVETGAQSGNYAGDQIAADGPTAGPGADWNANAIGYPAPGDEAAAGTNDGIGSDGSYAVPQKMIDDTYAGVDSLADSSDPMPPNWQVASVSASSEQPAQQPGYGDASVSASPAAANTWSTEEADAWSNSVAPVEPVAPITSAAPAEPVSPAEPVAWVTSIAPAEPRVFINATVLTTVLTTTLAPTTTMTTTLSRTRLFCFAVMMPSGYEHGLLTALLSKGLSLFGCEEYSVFSEGDIELSPGPPTRIGTVDVGSVKAQYGGEFFLALNSEVFVRIWKRVFSDGKFEKCDWTVKVDPDCVFLPERLRFQMIDSDPRDDVYLNDCDQGLHGPIEVMSRGGMEHFQSGMDSCVSALSYEWNKFGEDVFLRHCLGMLKVNRVDNFELLSEDRCMWENPAENGCISGKVSFHPFKNEHSWMTCYEQARQSPMKNMSSTVPDSETHAVTTSAPVYTQAAPQPAQSGCSAMGEDCRVSRCCEDVGLTCIQKNKWYAGCLEPKDQR